MRSILSNSMCSGVQTSDEIHPCAGGNELIVFLQWHRIGVVYLYGFPVEEKLIPWKWCLKITSIRH